MPPAQANAFRLMMRLKLTAKTTPDSSLKGTKNLLVTHRNIMTPDKRQIMAFCRFDKLNGVLAAIMPKRKGAPQPMALIRHHIKTSLLVKYNTR